MKSQEHPSQGPPGTNRGQQAEPLGRAVDPCQRALELIACKGHLIAYANTVPQISRICLPDCGNSIRESHSTVVVKLQVDQIRHSKSLFTQHIPIFTWSFYSTLRCATQISLKPHIAEDCSYPAQKRIGRTRGSAWTKTDQPLLLYRLQHFLSRPQNLLRCFNHSLRSHLNLQARNQKSPARTWTTTATAMAMAMLRR